MMRKIVDWFRKRRQKLACLGKLGKECYIATTVRFNFHKRIEIGDYVRLGHNCLLDGEGGIKIGDGSILASRVFILSSTHNYNQGKYLPFDNTDSFRAVTIGRGVWIGDSAAIVPGVEIADGAVVGMHAVVTKDVPKGAVVGGNPAVILKYRESPDIDRAVADKRYYLRAVFEENLKRR